MTDPGAPSENTPQRILVVDDDALVRQLLERILERRGFDASFASGPHDALALCGTNAYDIVLTDLQMPVMDGHALCAAIHELETHANTPVLALTAIVDPEMTKRALAAGIVDVMKKPFKVQELVAWLQHHARSASD